MRNKNPSSKIVLGVDPSLTASGWAVVAFPRKGATPFVRDWGIISPPSNKEMPMSGRLAHIHLAVRKVIRENPDIELVGVESPIVSRGRKTAILLGQVAGAVRTAIWLAGKRLIVEANPIAMKTQIAGDGHADKQQMAAAVADRMLLPLPELGGKKHKDDLTDAAAVAAFAEMQPA